MKKIPLDSIELEGCQSRAGTCESTVDEYAEAWKAKAEFPPVTLFTDGSVYYCGDGHHRILAADRAGVKSIAATVRKGGKSDALWHSAGANTDHGKRRTNADKRKAVKLALELKPDASNRMLAEHCNVSDALVAEVRKSTARTCSSANPPKRVGKDGKARPVPQTKAPDVVAEPVEEPEEEIGPDLEGAKHEFADIARRYDSILRDAKGLKDSPIGGYLRTTWIRFEEAHKATRAIINACKPNSICPDCEGEGCKGCESTGFLNRSTERNRA